MNTQPTLLIIGAGRGQTGLAKAGKRIGARVLAVTLPGAKLPVAPHADALVYADITDPDAVLQAIDGIHIDGVATSCLDKGIMSLGRVRDARGLVGLTEAAASRCNQKARMKEALVDAGVSTAEHHFVTSPQELKVAAHSLGFPVIVKALDLNGSTGVRVCNTDSDLLKAHGFIASASRAGGMIVEEFMEGVEVGAQAMVVNGEVLFVLPHGDQMHPEHPTVPIGHTVPLEVAPENLEAINAETRKAIQALGLDNCAVNIDIMMTDQGARVIELTGRVGANGLPEVVSAYFGVDYYEVVARLALGEDVAHFLQQNETRPKCVGARMLTTEAHGTVTSVDVDDSSIDGYDLFIGEGSTVSGFENSSDCIGQAFVTGENLTEVAEKLDGFSERLTVTTTPAP